MIGFLVEVINAPGQVRGLHHISLLGKAMQIVYGILGFSLLFPGSFLETFFKLFLHFA
jgi:hypothetical protein